jgi:hypothetical protein
MNEESMGVRLFVCGLFFVGCSDANQRGDAQSCSNTEQGGDAQAPRIGDAREHCVLLQASPRPEPALAACPATEATPECAAHDVDAVVARSDSCMDSWGAVPFQCVGWPALPPGQEFLVLTAHDCSFTISIQSAVACADHIEVSFFEEGHCATCDGQHSAMHVWSLPLDDRPVIANGKVLDPLCIP